MLACDGTISGVFVTNEHLHAARASFCMRPSSRHQQPLDKLVAARWLCRYGPFWPNFLPLNASNCNDGNTSTIQFFYLPNNVTVTNYGAGQLCHTATGECAELPGSCRVLDKYAINPGHAWPIGRAMSDCDPQTAVDYHSGPAQGNCQITVHWCDYITNRVVSGALAKHSPSGRAAL